MKPIAALRSHSDPRLTAQRGAVLLISLIILAVLLAAGAALVRSFDTSLFQAGNLAFRRDLANQAERATPAVSALFGTGGNLSTAGARAENRPADHYSATMLPTNAQGIPTALLATVPANAGVIPVRENGVTTATVYFLIDRMCMTPGDETTLGDRCVATDYSTPEGSVAGGGVNVLRQISYRVSVRVDGPRNTQAFFQSTLSL